MADADKMDVDTQPAPSTEAAAAQSQLGLRIQKYFAQLSTGCGGPCSQPFCGSNPALKRFNLTANQQAILAYSLAVKDPDGAYLAVHSKSASDVYYIDLPKLKELVEECKATNEYAPLIRHIGRVFSTSAYLNNSFSKNPKDIRLDGNDTGLDIDALKEAIAIFNTLPEHVQNVLASSAGRLAMELKINASRVTTSLQLRQFHILLLLPALKEVTYYKELLHPLVIAFSRLPSKSQRILKAEYFDKLDNQELVQFLIMLKDAIALHALEQQPGYTPNTDIFTVSSVSILDILHEINNEKHFVPYDAFYIDAINENISLKDDFVEWKHSIQKNIPGFSFCSHAYVFNPETKYRVLRIDSVVEQFRRRAMTVDWIEPPFLQLLVYRQNLIHTSLKQLEEIAKISPEFLKKELKVKFVGEEGVDEGGVQKEWFQLLVKQIFDPQYGMFLEIEETRIHWFNAQSEDYQDFDLIGKLLGLAIYNGNILDVHFPLVVYKKLLGFKPTLEDLKQINPGLYKGLRQLLEFEGNVEEFGLNFQVTVDVFGEWKTYDLKPDGENIAVTNENRQEYVDLYISWLLEDSIKQQFDAFKSGFQTVCNSEAMKMFQPEELELLVCGNPVLDFHELEKSAIYENGYNENHPVIKNFWSVVHELSEEQQKRLLFFTTGSDRAPIGGLGKLRLVIVRDGGDTSRLPSAHTCFNHLLLPEYESKEQLKKCLLKAIENAEGFGLM